MIFKIKCSPRKLVPNIYLFKQCDSFSPGHAFISVLLDELKLSEQQHLIAVFISDENKQQSFLVLKEQKLYFSTVSTSDIIQRSATRFEKEKHAKYPLFQRFFQLQTFILKNQLINLFTDLFEISTNHM